MLLIHGVDSAALEQVISSFYTGQCPVTAHQVVAVCDVATKLRVQPLLDASLNFMRDCCSLENCCIPLLQNSVQMGLLTGVEICINFITHSAERFAQVVALPGFLNCGYDAMMTVLKSGQTKGWKPDSLIAAAAATWLHHSPKDQRMVMFKERLVNDLKIMIPEGANAAPALSSGGDQSTVEQLLNSGRNLGLGNVWKSHVPAASPLVVTGLQQPPQQQQQGQQQQNMLMNSGGFQIFPNANMASPNSHLMFSLAQNNMQMGAAPQLGPKSGNGMQWVLLPQSMLYSNCGVKGCGQASSPHWPMMGAGNPPNSQVPQSEPQPVLGQPQGIYNSNNFSPSTLVALQMLEAQLWAQSQSQVGERMNIQTSPGDLNLLLQAAAQQRLDLPMSEVQHWPVSPRGVVGVALPAPSSDTAATKAPMIKSLRSPQPSSGGYKDAHEGSGASQKETVSGQKGACSGQKGTGASQKGAGASLKATGVILKGTGLGREGAGSGQEGVGSEQEGVGSGREGAGSGSNGAKPEDSNNKPIKVDDIKSLPCHPRLSHKRNAHSTDKSNKARKIGTPTDAEAAAMMALPAPVLNYGNHASSQDDRGSPPQQEQKSKQQGQQYIHQPLLKRSGASSLPMSSDSTAVGLSAGALGDARHPAARHAQEKSPARGAREKQQKRPKDSSSGSLDGCRRSISSDCSQMSQPSHPSRQFDSAQENNNKSKMSRSGSGSNDDWQDQDKAPGGNTSKIGSRDRDPSQNAHGFAHGSNRKPRTGEGQSGKPILCSIHGCNVDIRDKGEYYQRYKMCADHLKRLAVAREDGTLQRFCQQCGNLHNLDAFDGTKRSCRMMLQKRSLRRKERALKK